MTDIDKLLAVMARLRGPDGCPWDKEQTPESLKPSLVEETYEVLEALDSENPSDLCEELGDLLLQIVFHAQIAQERGDFSMQDVIDSIHAKLLHRHPHVFGDAVVTGTSEVLANWERIKAKEHEKKDKVRHSILDGIPRGIPALNEALKLGSKASRVGFDWKESAGIVAKIREEVDELEAMLDQGHDHTDEIKEEVGDVLFSVVNLCRFLNVDPETSLKLTNHKFKRRFQYIEQRLKDREMSVQDCSLEELENLWQEAKTWAN